MRYITNAGVGVGEKKNKEQNLNTQKETIWSAF